MERRSKFAGFWYPDDTASLDEYVDFTHCGGDLRFAVLPHAGLYYSAGLISVFFSNLDPGIEKVLIIAPSHYHRIRTGAFTVSSFTSSQTPYGSIRTIPCTLTPSVLDDRAVEDEHAVEMFLPFIKKSGDLEVSYALISHVGSYDEVKALSGKVGEYVDDRTSVIASSDFTHYGERFAYEPYGRGAVNRAVEADLNCARLLAGGDTREAYDGYIDSTICGIVPALILSEVAKRKGFSGVVGPHHTSVDRGGDADDFVSYCDVFWRK